MVSPVEISFHGPAKKFEKKGGGKGETAARIATLLKEKEKRGGRGLRLVPFPVAHW